jgi:putative hydrolase of the HAD superfamily
MITAGADIMSVYHAALPYNEGVPALSAPRVVLFDLDDTLFDHASAARAALMGVHGTHACFARRGFDDFAADHAEFLEALHLRVVAGEIGIDEARIERFRRLFAQAGVEAGRQLLEQTAAAYRRAYLDARRPIDGARDLLAALKPVAAIGIVSNNLLDEQREKVRECGFEPFIDALIVSEEAGTSKPDPAIFAVALERLGYAAGDAVMVGDSWSADIEGARAAGIRAVWFNRFGRPAPDADIAAIETFVPVQPAIDAILGRRSDVPPDARDAVEYLA